jgi:hypothetical protein
MKICLNMCQNLYNFIKILDIFIAIETFTNVRNQTYSAMKRNMCTHLNTIIPGAKAQLCK